jgi:Flp pilus assembly protein CpaB
MLSSLTRSSRGLLIIGAVLAVAAFALVVLLLNQKSPSNTATPPPTVMATATSAPGAVTADITPTAQPAGLQEVTAIHDVPAGTKFSDAATIALYFKNQAVPPMASVPLDAVASTDVLATSLISNTIRITNNIPRGAVLTTDSFELQPFSPPYSVAHQVRQGRVAESIQVQPLNADAGTIIPGDFVDVYLTLPDKDLSAYTFSPPVSISGSDQTQKILEDVRVISVAPATSSYTLELNQQDALLLKFVKDNGGTVDLVLMSAVDVKTQAAQPKTNPIVPQYFLTPQTTVKGTPQANGVIAPFDTPLPTLTPIPTPR